MSDTKTAEPKAAKPKADATETAKPTLVAAPRSPRRLHPSRFKVAEQERNLWLVYPEHGTEFEDLLEPSYWSHIAKNLRPGARIEVLAEDGSYWAELLVRATGNLSASVHPLRKVDLGNIPLPEASSFAVEYRGPVLKHAVIRKRDGSSIQSGFDTQEAAMQWLGLNSRTLAA